MLRVLVLSNEVWNDKINGNNVISNWFEGMKDVEFANIYCEPGHPYNKCCKKYFQLTDSMMAKSIVGGKSAGQCISMTEEDCNNGVAEEKPAKLYRFLKSITGDCLRLVRECIWLLGKYDLKKMQEFIDEFSPDIVFTERMASCKMLRLEETVSQLTNAPIVAFTGDDEYSYRQLKFSPFFWINRAMVRARLRHMVKKYKIYYTLSEEQRRDYEKRFGVKTKILQKCGDLSKTYEERKVNDPIKIVYAGKLYCNRWKVLAEIASVLKEINSDGQKIVLQIYTKDAITKKQKILLDDAKNSCIMGAVSQEELTEVYRSADIALHVESRDLKYRLATRLSFSTKIIDCIASGCAVMAVCWDQHSGYTYLERNDAALCASTKDKLTDILTRIANDPSIIKTYARKAYDCGVNNHTRERVQKDLFDDFSSIVKTSQCTSKSD